MQLTNQFMKNYKKISVYFICIVALVGFAFVLVNNYKTKTSLKYSEKTTQNTNTQKVESTPQDTVSKVVNKNAKKVIKTQISNDILKVSSSDIVLGDKNAPVVMIEYSSLSCPHCAAFTREALEKIKNDYVASGKVQFIHREFPLNQPALAAGMFAICRSQGEPVKYYNLLKALFKTQDSWAYTQEFIDKLRSIAQLDGMSGDEFNSCINNQKMVEKILKARMAASESLEIQSTPTFFINGEKTQGYVDYASIKKVIDAQISQAQK